MARERKAGELEELLDEALVVEPLSDAEWLARAIEAHVTVEINRLTPSQWAEQHRYLGAAQSQQPGFYSFDLTPYWREVLDCLAPESPARLVDVIKGAQVGFTAGVLENGIGYVIAVTRTAPAMLLTAEDELAKLRIEQFIIPMLHDSGLMHLIRTSDTGNKRKTGRTSRRIEWVGGGYLLPVGAKSANKLRSVPIQVLFEDEVDGYPDRVGKDGDPQRLAEERTAGFEVYRKIIRGSTPTLAGASRIQRGYLAGDQCELYVPCIHCGEHQVLRWRGRNEETGEVWGMQWDEREEGVLAPGTVRYICRFCGGAMTNGDKRRMLRDYQWRPGAQATTPHHRSFKVPGLYAPIGMRSWDECVVEWLAAWDTKRNVVRDVGKLQVFYNNILAEPFELQTDRLRFQTASSHRRRDYRLGEVPNRHAERVAGGRIALLTAFVDVHDKDLAVAVIGWTPGRCAYVVDYRRIPGDPTNPDDPSTWGRIRKLVEVDQYMADTGERYQVALCLIDSGHEYDIVYRFCAQYAAVVFPSKGQEVLGKTARFAEFNRFKTKLGTDAYGIAVDIYKDRWHHTLRRSWNGLDRQPEWTFNAPIDLPDDAIRELTREVRREKLDKATGRSLGWEWHRPGGAPNELWDCLVGCTAGFEIVAHNICQLAANDADAPLSWDLAMRVIAGDPHAVRVTPP